MDKTKYGWNKRLFLLFHLIGRDVHGVKMGASAAYLGRNSGASPVQMNGYAPFITLQRCRLIMEGQQLIPHLFRTEYSRNMALASEHKFESKKVTFIETLYFSLFVKEENDD